MSATRGLTCGNADDLGGSATLRPVGPEGPPGHRDARVEAGPVGGVWWVQIKSRRSQPGGWHSASFWLPAPWRECGCSHGSCSTSSTHDLQRVGVDVPRTTASVRVWTPRAQLKEQGAARSPRAATLRPGGGSPRTRDARTLGCSGARTVTCVCVITGCSSCSRNATGWTFARPCWRTDEQRSRTGSRARPPWPDRLTGRGQAIGSLV